MTQNSNRDSLDHVPWLDGLRGGAALLVVISHIQILSGLRSIPVVSWGGLAVDLFMLLSGFLMAHHYIGRRAMEPWEQFSTVSKFWVRRFFRIAPVYYFLFAIAIYSGPWLGGFRAAIAAVWPSTGTPMERYLDHSLDNILVHLSFAFGFLPDYAFRTPLPDWSIGLEMQYYLVFPAMMLLVARLGAIPSTMILLGTSALVCVVFADFVSQFQMPSFLPMKLYMFIVGIWIAIGRDQKRLNTGLVVSTLIAAAIFLADRSQIALSRLLLIVGLYYLMDDGTLPFSHALAPTISRMRRLLSSRLSRFLGDTSYSTYLLHLMILLPIAGFLVNQEWYRSLNQYGRFALCTIAVVPAVYLISLALFLSVEKPGIWIGKRLLSRLQPKSSGLGAMAATTSKS